MSYFYFILALIAATYIRSVELEDGSQISAATHSNYTGPLRPQLQFSPPQNWMGHPTNLFIDADNIWHLYYQCKLIPNTAKIHLAQLLIFTDAPESINPGYGRDWGHATSRDLWRWQNQPIALYGDGLGSILSGSAVIDVNNTSGFFPEQRNVVVAIYTISTPEEEAQAIAYSTDGGYTFTKYTDNPVLSRFRRGLRNPKVIWHSSSRKWVMVVAHSDERFIAFYTSPNLRHWMHESDLRHAAFVDTIECPNIASIPMAGASEPMYILTVSMRSGNPFGGSTVVYIPGHFDGLGFHPVDNRTDRFTEFGQDNYATQFFYGTKYGENPVSISWATNTDYALDVPTGPREGWRGAMGLPRIHHLANISSRGYDLISEPYPPIPLTFAVASCPGGYVECIYGFGFSPSQTAYIDAQLLLQIDPAAKNEDKPLDEVDFSFSTEFPPQGGVIRGVITLGETTTFSPSRAEVDGFSNSNVTKEFSIHTSPTKDGKWRLQMLMDRSLLEIFLNNGSHSATVAVYPKDNFRYFDWKSMYRPGSINNTAMVYDLHNGWESTGVLVAQTGGTGRNEEQQWPIEL